MASPAVTSSSSEKCTEWNPQHNSDHEKHAVASCAGNDQATTTASQADSKNAPSPYSTFSTKQKRIIATAASFSTCFSPLTASIYFPAINQISRELAVSTSELNLTVTTYLIMMGIAPILIAPFSDNLGRRPAYILVFTIYLAANLGLALQQNYAALLVLRLVQSAGASGTIPLAQGVIADIVTTSERGQYIAFATMGQVLAPAIAPVLGGVLARYLGWHSIFWCLLILGGCFFVALLLFLPETCRNIVGDGSAPPPRTHTSILAMLQHRKLSPGQAVVPNCSWSQLSPLVALKALTDVESLIVLVATALAVVNIYAVSTAASTIYRNLYGFGELYVGLMFLPMGVGAAVASMTTGRLIDKNFRRHADRLGIRVRRDRQSDLANFNIERARLEVGIPFLLLASISMIMFGWVTNQKVSLAAPIVVGVFQGYVTMSAFQVLNVLMIDIYPGRAATITAAGNFVRGELSAVFTAAIGPMIGAMGSGWAFTFTAMLQLLYTPLVVLVMMRGMKWRQTRRQKQKASSPA